MITSALLRKSVLAISAIGLLGFALSQRTAAAPGQQINTTPGVVPPPGVIQMGRPSQIPEPGLPPIIIGNQNKLGQRQKDAIIKENFKKTKEDVAQLGKLTQALEQEIAKSNPNVLSLTIVKNASKIEKLAKKIKNEAKEY